MRRKLEGQGSAFAVRGFWLLSFVIGAHAAVLSWILLNAGVATAVRTVPPTLTLVQFAPRSFSPRPHQSQLAKTEVAVVAPSISPMTPVQLPASLTEAALAVPAEDGCDLTEVVQAAVREDAEARTALQSLPQDSRSVANAIMLWDGGWTVDRRLKDQNAIGLVRRVLVAAISNSSAGCREAMQAGPRLLTVAGPPDMVLAIGSGRWRWGDLVFQEPRAADASLDPSPTKTEITGLAESEGAAR